MSAVADPSPLASAATATLAEADWLEAAYFGAGLPREAEHELQLGAAAYHREEEAETHLRRALELAPWHPATYIGLYRFYFYKNRLGDALAVGWRCLEQAAQDNGLPADWRDVAPGRLDIADYDVRPRFYLFTLKACAYLNLRLGELETGGAMLAKLAALDPGDKLGGSVLQAVLDRLGQDDDE